MLYENLNDFILMSLVIKTQKWNLEIAWLFDDQLITEKSSN